MPFTGKATYSAGATLPEIAEDISDLVSISSPHETPLLDALGDPARPARSTVHEWIEDALLPNSSVITDESFTSATADTTFEVDDAAVFQAGDQVRVQGSDEVMLVSSTNTGAGTITVVRGYGGTTAEALDTDQVLQVISNASLEGGDAAAARFTSRVRQSNYTQIFAATLEVSGSELAVKQIGVADELDYQKQLRTRELLRDLENAVINGVAPSGNPQGSASVRRTMRGIAATIATNIFVPGSNSFPAGATLTEAQLNEALRRIWKDNSSSVDLIVVGGAEKRAINQFVASNRRFTSQSDSYRDLVSTYESDFGVCRIVLSRHVNPGTVLLLDSSRIEVMPLSGRNFHYKPLAVTGDRESGQVIGEYTLEMRNEAAHGVIKL
jgi:hypothetical protein